MRLNLAKSPKRTQNWPKTHEGAPAYPEVSYEQQLSRSTLSCLLWEDEFYESGQKIGERIHDLAGNCPSQFVADLAVRARHEYKLRHAPLLMLSALCKTGSGSRIVSKTITKVIGRPDELSELLAVYWRDGRKPLSNQLKKGLRQAFAKFDAYQLAKYDRANQVRLRDVMFLVHPKADSEKAEALYKQLADETLRNKSTWEARLSKGESKKETWSDLLSQGRLGYMALLRNLRNMEKADVDEKLVKEAILARKGAGKVLPFRFVAAARHAPKYLNELDRAFKESISDIESDGKKTVVLVDVSWSMSDKLSGKSDMARWDAAAALAVMVPGHTETWAFSNELMQVNHEGGLKAIDQIIHCMPNGGTALGAAVAHINNSVAYDRLIVITDEQSHDFVETPKGRGYMINVASNQNGVGYGDWVHVDGFSEQVLRFIAAYETDRT